MYRQSIPTAGGCMDSRPGKRVKTIKDLLFSIFNSRATGATGEKFEVFSMAVNSHYLDHPAHCVLRDIQVRLFAR
jgi:hypothetical protein